MYRGREAGPTCCVARVGQSRCARLVETRLCSPGGVGGSELGEGRGGGGVDLAKSAPWRAKRGTWPRKRPPPSSLPPPSLRDPPLLSRHEQQALQEARHPGRLGRVGRRPAPRELSSPLLLPRSAELPPTTRRTSPSSHRLARLARALRCIHRTEADPRMPPSPVRRSSAPSPTSRPTHPSRAPPSPSPTATRPRASSTRS